MRRWLGLAVVTNLVLATLALVHIDEQTHVRMVDAQQSLTQNTVPLPASAPDSPDTEDVSLDDAAPKGDQSDAGRHNNRNERSGRSDTNNSRKSENTKTDDGSPEVTVPSTPVTTPIGDPGGDEAWARTPSSSLSAAGLWLVDADKQDARLLIGDIAPATMSFSPDGKRVAVSAYTRYPWDGRDDIRMYIVDVATGERREIAENLNIPSGPAWSPDGKWIAFHANYFDLWVVRPDGSDLHKVAGTDQFRGRIAWAPIGHRLVTPLPNDDAVLIVDVDAETEQRWPYPNAYIAAWSPAGDRLSVSGMEGPTHVMNPLTGKFKQLLADGRYARWSPNAELIAMYRDGEMGVMPASGGAFRVLGSGMPTNWSSDGRSIDYQAGTYSFQVVNLASGRSRTVASVSGTDLSVSPSVWVPGTRLVSAIVAPQAAHYNP